MTKKIVISIGNSGKVCNNCRKLEKNINKAIEQLKNLNVDFEIKHITVTAPEFIKKYGSLMTPVLLFDDNLITSGEVPNYNVLKAALQQYISQIFES
ncbi:MAG: thioredoxin family protein [Promethearchaeota archaeon]